MKNIRLFYASLLILFVFSFVPVVSAHCPLCTAGIIAMAGGAELLGVNVAVIGLFVGAFSISIGVWASKLIKKQYFKYQTALITLASFLLTVLPLLPMMTAISPFYISLTGTYGSLLNRTYILNNFFMTSILGAIIMCASPWISRKISRMRGKSLPFQGIILTFIMLAIFGLILQVV